MSFFDEHTFLANPFARGVPSTRFHSSRSEFHRQSGELDAAHVSAARPEPESDDDIAGDRAPDR